ncbi:copper chaperone PCu(A)C [Marinobacter sp. C2H3]|uniref:copper chaperone PCu(A)C n=1 Tax=Marinobacter sp. C2H3 TaxID=3119003 RepID=UPI00300F3784
MRTAFRCLTTAGPLLALLPSLALAAGIEVSDARIRLLPGDTPGAGYFRLHNGTEEPVRLTGARSNAYLHIMLHESMQKDGMASMHAVPSLEIAPGAGVELKPGGYHLMMMQRQAPLSIGDEVPVTLEFDGRDALPVMFKVVSPAAM